MSTFSDDDLKRLKEYNLLNPILYREFTRENMKALLARLEAAESALKGFHKMERETMNYDTVVELWNAWRKACGK